MSVQFEDFSIKVKETIEREAIAFLHEAAGEVVSEVARNISRFQKGRWHSDQAKDWRYVVDESNLEATIGNPTERSLWVEFGTGIYAEKGNGRKGYWVYVKDSDTGDTKSTGGKAYTLDEAKKIVAMMRSEGLDAHYTQGQPAYRPFQNAYIKMKPKIKKMARDRFKGMK